MPVFKSVNNISHSYGGLKNVINYITSGEKERIYIYFGRKVTHKF